MMKIIIPLLLIFSCSDSASLGRVCPETCYSGTPETLDKGVCRAGKPICDAKANVVSCDGEVLPSQDICDGKDTLCTGGKVDNFPNINLSGFVSGQYGLIEYPCLSFGECRYSYASCVGGSWVCLYPLTVELDSDGRVSSQEKRCDGLDGSCDGRSDENILYDPPFCFDGTISQATNPPCRVGVWSCENATKVCSGQVLPSVEICNNIDDDCSGIIDDTSVSLETNFDIVFIIDTSGSMFDKIRAVAGALDAYVEQFDGNPHFRFALVIMSSSSGSLVQVDTDFTDFSNIRARIQSLQGNGSGLEASLDAMFDVCSEANTLGLSWRQETDIIKMAFVFTDEIPQSYTDPTNTRQMVIDACVVSETSLFIWSMTNYDFDLICQGTGGIHFDIITDWETIFDEMNSIVFRDCE